VFTGAREFDDAAGIQVYEISVASEVERDVVTSAQAVELAGHLIAATQWVEDHQRPEPGDR